MTILCAPSEGSILRFQFLFLSVISSQFACTDTNPYTNRNTNIDTDTNTHSNWFMVRDRIGLMPTVHVFLAKTRHDTLQQLYKVFSLSWCIFSSFETLFN